MPTTMTGEITDVTDHVMTTCRILAMTHRDYGGMATKLLARFAPPGILRSSGDEALEYRTYHVLERLASTTLAELRALLSEMFGIDDAMNNIEAEIGKRLARTTS